MVDIRDDVPIPEEFREETYMRLPGYVIYYDIDPDELDDCGLMTRRELGMMGKIREGVCTCCGEVFSADAKDSGPLGRLYEAYHNGMGYCPACDQQVQYKARGRLRTCETMYKTTRLLFVQVMDYNCVWLRGFVIEATYDKDGGQPNLHFMEQVRYELVPGQARCFKRNYSHFYGVGRTWHEIKSIAEPWPINYMGSGIWYSISGLVRLQGSFLRYVPFKDFFGREFPERSYKYVRSSRTPWGRIFSYAAMYPALEMAVKLGCWELLDDLVGLDLKNGRYVNWGASDVGRFLRMPKADAKKLIRGVCVNRLKLYRLFGNADDALRYEGFDADKLSAMAARYGDPAIKIIKYLTKHRYRHNGLSVLLDYWQNAALLGRDMGVELIRFPKDLRQAHDDFHAAAERLREEQRALGDAAKEPKYRETYQNYRRLYEWADGEYMAIVPPLLRDIKLEGQEMHHCVGGYLDRHASGTTIIIFIRKKMLPARSLYTVEISPEGQLRQVQGFHNEWRNKPTQDARDFVDRWLIEVGRRLAEEKKNKKKNKKARKSA